MSHQALSSPVRVAGTGSEWFPEPREPVPGPANRPKTPRFDLGLPSPAQDRHAQENPQVRASGTVGNRFRMVPKFRQRNPSPDPGYRFPPYGGGTVPGVWAPSGNRRNHWKVQQLTNEVGRR